MYTCLHDVKSDGKVVPSDRAESSSFTRVFLEETDHHLSVCMWHLEHILGGGGGGRGEGGGGVEEEQLKM